MPVFRDRVRRCLAGLPVDVRDAHPSAFPPPPNETRSKRRCKSCWYFTRKESRTIRICNMCGPICKGCDKPYNGVKPLYEQLYLIPTTMVQPRRAYKREKVIQ